MGKNLHVIELNLSFLSNSDQIDSNNKSLCQIKGSSHVATMPRFMPGHKSDFIVLPEQPSARKSKSSRNQNIYDQFADNIFSVNKVSSVKFGLKNGKI